MHAHGHKPVIAQLCLHQHNQAGNGFYRYFDIYIMADVSRHLHFHIEIVRLIPSEQNTSENCNISKTSKPLL
jgi:hypothetical protein